eukprot:523019-Prorocentrum_minimum.AAC.1
MEVVFMAMEPQIASRERMEKGSSICTPMSSMPRRASATNTSAGMLSHPHLSHNANGSSSSHANCMQGRQREGGQGVRSEQGHPHLSHSANGSSSSHANCMQGRRNGGGRIWAAERRRHRREALEG